MQAHIANSLHVVVNIEDEECQSDLIAYKLGSPVFWGFPREMDENEKIALKPRSKSMKWILWLVESDDFYLLDVMWHSNNHMMIATCTSPDFRFDLIAVAHRLAHNRWSMGSFEIDHAKNLRNKLNTIPADWPKTGRNSILAQSKSVRQIGPSSLLERAWIVFAMWRFGDPWIFLGLARIRSTL